MSETQALLPKEGGDYNDFVLNAPGVWVESGALVVHIARRAWGLHVEILPNPTNSADPIDSASAFYEDGVQEEEA